MATTRIKDLSKTATTVASDANIVIDGPSNGTQKITRDNFRQDTADAFVAAPSTYKLAPLNGVNKIDATYLPTSGDTPKGEWNASSNSPALADGSGVAGDYYDVTTAGTQNLGSGSIIFTVGDVVKYNGSTWFKIDSVANILDGSATAADGRSALSVNSIDEDAQANALKVTAPALYFNGSSSKITVANSSILDFGGDGNDLPMTISGTILVRSNSTNFFVWAAWYSFREIVFYVDTNGKLTLGLSDGTNDTYALGSTVVPLNQVTHVAVTYPGAGPQSANDFPANQNGTKMYINGVAETVTPINNASYGGLVVRNQSYQIGADGSYFGQGSIRDCKIFNRELTASEVAELARGNDLGFADEWGDPTDQLVTDGDMEDAGTTAWANSTSTISKETSSPYAGTRNIKCILNGGVTGYFEPAPASAPAVAGKRYRATFWYRTGGTSPGAYSFRGNGGSWQIISTLAESASWTRHSVEFVTNADSNGRLAFHIESGADASTYIEVDAFTLYSIGTLADFRAEDYNESANKLLDRSSNNFVGVGTSVTLSGNQRHISADTIDLKNLPTSSAGLSAGEVWSNGGVLTVV